jgi:hypothetical protein
MPRFENAEVFVKRMRWRLRGALLRLCRGTRPHGVVNKVRVEAGRCGPGRCKCSVPMLWESEKRRVITGCRT